LVHKYDPDYYQRNAEHIKRERKKYRDTHPHITKAQHERVNLRRRDGAEALKQDVFTRYGNGVCACVRCGYGKLNALTLDHIIPIGRGKRRVTGLQFYKHLRKENYPDIGLQTLCANCQMLKMFEGNEWVTNQK
jgi:5-methylcytosine-specific restriction endonuclease McrA